MDSRTDWHAKIVPSVLPADFARLGEGVQLLEKAGVDRIQWDVMDGHFVPNLTFGPDIIAAARNEVSVGFEAHLMVSNPDALLSRYVEAGCEIVIVHAETTPHLHRTLGSIADLGARPAVALNPSTPLDMVAHVVDLIDLLLVMTVNPGFGGQDYLTSMEPKIAAARELIDGSGRPIELEVDGGVSPSTIAGAARAGAEVFCAGSAVWGHEGGPERAVKELRAKAEGARR
ncbi:MAG TPA: ribulose-phosphate 3-epimerase [Egibacteraceae bacterium]|nr:ribulose-phosphate 3-epimerase [Actinomycetota bacterium]HWB70778.1 ribulose-phosphate 3-epimerase [Egibacteraceae bacterium]